jgi:HSP20 family protein
MSFLNTIAPSLARNGARETTRDSSPSVRPYYEIKENDDAWGLTVYLPGVDKSNLSIVDENGAVTVRGERNWKQPSGWTTLYRESSELPYELVLEHENVIDSEKIVAELKDGVLRVSLPKTEARKPRKIAVS